MIGLGFELFRLLRESNCALMKDCESLVETWTKSAETC